MIGAVFSGSLTANGERILINQTTDGHSVFVDRLFGRAPIPEGMGMYVLANHNQRYFVRQHIEFKILLAAADNKAIMGAHVNIFGLPLAFLLAPPTCPTALFADAIYRPSFIEFHGRNGAVRHMHLSWVGSPDRDGVICKG
jgi:hypothetical protein